MTDPRIEAAVGSAQGAHLRFSNVMLSRAAAENIARAVILAFLDAEPSEGMIRAAHEHTQTGEYSTEDHIHMLWHWDTVWRAMAARAIEEIG